MYDLLPSDDPLQRCPDLTLARDQLGWQPTTASEQDMEKNIAYFARLPLAMNLA